MRLRLEELSYFPVSSSIVLLLAVALVFTIGVITCVVSGRGMGGRPEGPAEPTTAPPVGQGNDEEDKKSPETENQAGEYNVGCSGQRSFVRMESVPKPSSCLPLLDGLPKNPSFFLLPVADPTPNVLFDKMLRVQPVMDRLEHEVAVQRDRHIRLRSVQTDIALDLPPSITLPDGEEYPYNSSRRLKIRDPEQESEIYRKCIKPPPNRTIYGRECSPPPPPYRSNSAGLVPSNWSSGSSSSVVRCHSVSSSSSKRPTNILGRTVRCLSGKRCHHPASEESSVPSISTSQGSSNPTSISVLVPSYRCRRLSAFSEKAGQGSNLASVPTVQCVTPATSSTSNFHPSSGSSAQNQSHSMSSGASLCENRTNDNKNKSKCERSTF